MRNTFIVGILICAMTAGSTLLAQSNADELAQLKERVSHLEKQLQEITRLLEPLKAQLGKDNRRTMLREKFTSKMARDRAKYTPKQLDEAESLYQVANQKWGSPEANESLQTMIKKYPDINRTGCAILYVAQNSKGDESAKYLQDCIEKYNDCFYGNGVQVGAYARFLLAEDYRSKGEDKKAEALFSEIKASYSDAVDHSGKLLIDSIKAEAK